MENSKHEGGLRGAAIEDREHRSEVLLRFIRAAQKIEAFHDEKIETVFSTEQHKRKFIQDVSSEQFIQLLSGLNGILRNKNQEDWSMDGETVQIEGLLMGVAYVPPMQEDKTELLFKVLRAAKTMSERGDVMDDIALLVSSSLSAIHPFSDANGRTSRVIYLLLTEGFNEKGEQRLRSALSEYGRDEVDINPGLIGYILENMIREELGLYPEELTPETIFGLWREKFGDFEFHDSVQEGEKKLFARLLKSDPDYVFFAVTQYLSDVPSAHKYIRKFPRFSRILIEDLVKDLDSKSMHQILANYRKLKNEYVEKLIDCIANPDKEEYQTPIDGKIITLKALFQNKIRENQERIAEIKRSEGAQA